MTTLDDEIARVAALRGRAPGNYAVEAREISRRRRGVYAAEIRDLFRVSANVEEELRWWDVLPRRSRQALMDLPLNSSARKYADLLERMEDEALLIEAIRDQLPSLVHDWVLDHYGRDHPSARKLT